MTCRSRERKEGGHGSILVARHPGCRYWACRCDCADKGEEEESPLTESSFLRLSASKRKASRSSGKSIEGIHFDHGKTLVMRVTPELQGKMTFHCDLYPDVQGEAYLMDVPVG